MTEHPYEPHGPLGERIELVSPNLSRLELTVPEEDIRPVQPRRGPAWFGLAGTAVLAGGLAVTGVAGFVQDQFARSAVLGWSTAGVAVAGFGLIGIGIARELRGMARLSRVDRLRADLQSGDAVRIAAASRVWLAILPGQDDMRAAVDSANDPDAIEALLRAGPAATARRGADALGRRAARQLVAALAATPSPGLAVLVTAWRGVRLVREVAELYGLRPGVFATIGLMRRTAMAASLVGAAELATNAAAHALLSSPLLAHALGDVAGAGVAARRMMVLARAAAAACDPTSPPESRGG